MNTEESGESKMFETKEVVTEKRKKRFYTILMVYWIAVPVVYFASFLLLNGGSRQSYTELLGENLAVTLNVLMLIINLILACVLYATDIPERKRGGVSDIVLKLAIPQQLIVGNMIGAILAFLAFNELVDTPLITEKEEKITKPLKVEQKSGVMILLIVLIVVSLGIAYANWRVS